MFSVRVVLISIAIVLVLGAVFVAVSIVYRMVRREFVHKLGWVEVSVPATAERDFGEVDEFYRRVVMDAWERNEEMAGRLERAASRWPRRARSGIDFGRSAVGCAVLFPTTREVTVSAPRTSG